MNGSVKRSEWVAAARQGCLLLSATAQVVSMQTAENDADYGHVERRAG